MFPCDLCPSVRYRGAIVCWRGYRHTSKASPYLWLSLRTPPVRPALCVQSVHFQSKFFWIVHNIVCAVYLVFLPIGKAKCRVAGFSVFLVLVDRNRKCVGNLNIITETDTVKRAVSYTHLDVYKRQVPSYLRQGEPASHSNHRKSP